MKITDRLKVEHGVFLQQLRLLERLTNDGAPLPVLAAVADTIAVAEERHSELEDRLLYAALRKVVGREAPSLVQVAEEHAAVARQVSRIRSGRFAASDITALIAALRAHLEHEIHSVFVMAEEVLEDARLEALADWDTEHVYEEVGRREEYLEAAGARS